MSARVSADTESLNPLIDAGFESRTSCPRIRTSNPYIEDVRGSATGHRREATRHNTQIYQTSPSRRVTQAGNLLSAGEPPPGGRGLMGCGGHGLRHEHLFVCHAPGGPGTGWPPAPAWPFTSPRDPPCRPPRSGRTGRPCRGRRRLPAPNVAIASDPGPPRRAALRPGLPARSWGVLKGWASAAIVGPSGCPIPVGT